jgi:hypothetical protein
MDDFYSADTSPATTRNLKRKLMSPKSKTAHDNALSKKRKYEMRKKKKAAEQALA